MSRTYNPWNMWRPTLSRRNLEPWPNSSDNGNWTTIKMHLRELSRLQKKKNCFLIRETQQKCDLRCLVTQCWMFSTFSSLQLFIQGRWKHFIWVCFNRCPYVNKALTWYANASADMLSSQKFWYWLHSVWFLGPEALKFNTIGGNMSPHNHFSSYWFLLENILNTVCSELYSGYKDYGYYLKHNSFQQWPTLCSPF